MSYVYLTLEEILRLHFQIIEDYGGLHGVRDEHRLLSAIKAPQQKVFGQQQYTSLYEKAAIYLRAIISDHPFSDGNKRTALVMCGIFLVCNGKSMRIEPEELEDFIVRIATERLSIAEISEWLQVNNKSR